MLEALLGFFGFLFLKNDRTPHRQLIKQWATPFRMKIKWLSRYENENPFSVDVDEAILYISKYNKAVHSSEKQYIYSVAHEFGHLIDNSMQDHFLEEAELQKLATENEQAYQDEVRAWKIGKILLKNAKLFETKSFEKLKRYHLKNYRVALSLDRKGQSVKKS